MNNAMNPGELFDRLERFIHVIDAWEPRETELQGDKWPPHVSGCQSLQLYLSILLRCKSSTWLAGDLRLTVQQLRHRLSHAIAQLGKRGKPLTGVPSMRAACQAREAAKRMLDHREMLTEQRRPLTDGQRSLWCALDGKAMNTKELAEALDTSPGTVRHWKGGLCRIGHPIERRHGRGYYRPDAPPSDL